MLTHLFFSLFLSHSLSSEPALDFKTPQKNPALTAPVLSAEAAIAYDTASKTVLYKKNIFEMREMASISKLMTAIIVLDNHKLDEKLTVSKKAADMISSKIWLLPSEEISAENALYGLLIASGNDAAVALAEFDSVTEENFVKKMNAKAHEIGLTNTHFSNAAGLDDKNSYSTAYDILKLSLKALEYPFIKKAVALQKLEIRSTNGKIKHKLKNTNELLGNDYFNFYGLKTGKTEGAGPSFVGLAKAKNGNEILTVVLGSNNRFQDTKVLLDWVERAY